MPSWRARGLPAWMPRGHGRRTRDPRCRGSAPASSFIPQPPFIPGYERPETIWVSTPPDRIGPGPADRRMYVIDPLLEKQPYQFPYLPPYAGALRPPAEAGPDGHFDHIPTGTPRIRGGARLCLRAARARHLRELSRARDPLVLRADLRAARDRAAARAGTTRSRATASWRWARTTARGEPQPFALNFDAVAHEIGHLVIFGVMGAAARRAAARIFRLSRGGRRLHRADRPARISTPRSTAAAAHARQPADHQRARPLRASSPTRSRCGCSAIRCG